MVPCFLYFSGSFQKLKKENLLKRKSFTHQCASYDNSSLIIVINFDTSASKIQKRTFMCKKQTRTTKMKRRKNMLKLVFKILEAISSSLSKAWRFWKNHSTNKNPQKTLKHLSTRQKPKTWAWTKSHSQLRKNKHPSTVSQNLRRKPKEIGWSKASKWVPTSKDLLGLCCCVAVMDPNVAMCYLLLTCKLVQESHEQARNWESSIPHCNRESVSVCWQCLPLSSPSPLLSSHHILFILQSLHKQNATFVAFWFHRQKNPPNKWLLNHNPLKY